MAINLGTDESVACPLCGQDMAFDGSEWVCQHSGACEPVRASVKRSFPDAPAQYQTTLLAAMLEGGQIKVEFRVVRGQNGVDAYRVMAGDGYGDQDWLPEYVRRHEWVWQEWIPGEVAA